MTEALTATLTTTQGTVTVRLFPDHAPKTVRNFVELAEGGKEWTNPVTRVKSKDKLFDGTLRLADFWTPYNDFHRVPAALAMLVANARFFHLNTRLELILGAAWIAGSCLVLFWSLRRSLPH